MKNIFLIFVTLLLATAAEATGQSFKVIVNNANPTAAISQSDLSAIFLKTKARWDDGSSIVPVDLSARSEIREDFSQQVHGRRVAAIRSHWQQAAFSGAGTAPLERSSDAEVIEFIRTNPGAIGYISAAADASGVKVISISN